MSAHDAVRLVLASGIPWPFLPLRLGPDDWWAPILAVALFLALFLALADLGALLWKRLWALARLVAQKRGA